MNEVPNIISTKDLAYIEDMIKWNLTMSKKARMYKEITNDKDLKTLFGDIDKNAFRSL